MAKAGRNDQCPCGSGKKYKKCCGPTEAVRSSRWLVVLVGGAVLAAIIAGVMSFSSESSGAGGRVWDPAHGHYHNASGQEVP